MELYRSSGGSQSTFDPRVDAPKSDNKDPMTPLDVTLPRGPPITEQSIVPQLLIDHYVSMTDPSRAQTVDTEIARHCAFSLPAVALTLGRSNWLLLKDTYEALATDMQWKVRRTLASSIHELGVILGEEFSGTDLIPIFNGFLKDLDEVRQGLLKHLADFLGLLRVSDRRNYLPKLSEFLKMDNDRNWRFRQELADQLELLIPLYSPSEIEEFVSPIAMVLVHDKVASVRQSAVNVIAAIVKSLSESDKPELATSLLRCAIESLARETLWVHRQTFAALSLVALNSGAVNNETFSTELLPHLLDLAVDNVANVRLAVARTLSEATKTRSDFFRDEDANPHLERLVNIEADLKEDVDVDVRHFYGGKPKEFAPLPEETEDEFYDQQATTEEEEEEEERELEEEENESAEAETEQRVANASNYLESLKQST